MSIKEKANRLRRIEQLKKELAIYEDAIKAKYRFSYYYAKKIPALEQKIELLKVL